MKLTPPGPVTGLSIIALVLAAAVGGSSAAAGAATPATPATSTTDPNLTKIFDFESGTDVGVLAGVGQAGVAVDAAARQSGDLGLHVTGATSYGDGVVFRLPTIGLPEGWYDLNFPIKLPPGGLWTRVQAETAGSSTPGTWAVNDWTLGPSAHVKVFANTSWVLVKVVSFTICPSDPFPPASEFFIDNIRLRRSQTQSQIPYPTLGCPGTTTTTTTTTTRPASTTTSTTTTTTRSGIEPPARMSYTETRWPGGFQGNITLTNTGSVPVRSWVLEFTLPGASLRTAWGVGPYTQIGNRVTLTAPAWASQLAPGQSAQLGFVADGSGHPGFWALNGIAFPDHD